MSATQTTMIHGNNLFLFLLLKIHIVKMLKIWTTIKYIHKTTKTLITKVCWSEVSRKSLYYMTINIYYFYADAAEQAKALCFRVVFGFCHRSCHHNNSITTDAISSILIVIYLMKV